MLRSMRGNLLKVFLVARYFYVHLFPPVPYCFLGFFVRKLWPGLLSCLCLCSAKDTSINVWLELQLNRLCTWTSPWKIVWYMFSASEEKLPSENIYFTTDFYDRYTEIYILSAKSWCEQWAHLWLWLQFWGGMNDELQEPLRLTRNWPG